MEFKINIKDSASIQMLDMCSNSQEMVRIFVQLSRQDGFSYGFTLENEQNDDDFLMIKKINGSSLRIVIDSMSLQYLNDVTIDFLQDEKTFIVKHHNAAK